MLRRTKIVATLGPATDDPKMLDAIIEAGVDMVRVNFSHGNKEEHARRVTMIRERAALQGRHVGVLADLQGPKIRTERFRDGAVILKEGARFILDPRLGTHEGTEDRVGITYKDLPKDVRRGDTLLLDDGKIVLWVDEVVGSEVVCRVVVGGELSNNKGINRQGGGLSASALTAKDRADIEIAAEVQADYIAVSFPRSALDIEEAIGLLRAAGGMGGVVAKIERAEALTNIDEIIAVSDAVMVARGDLGVEIGDAELPGVQKDLIMKARQMNRVVITATQMMQSMVDNPIPTRAEVFDVANAVLDGTDAVMLSAETAVGHYPDKAIAAMDRVCRGAESQKGARISDHRLNTRFSRVDESIAMATMYTANHLGVAAIAALTESGSTPLWMSRISSAIPIYALTRHIATRRRATLYRGVYPIEFIVDSTDHNAVDRAAIQKLVDHHAVRENDWVILTRGDLVGVHGGTNTMRVVRVGDILNDNPGYHT